MGGDKVLYSYENEFLDARLGAGHGRSFRDWVLEHEQADRSRFLFPGLVSYETYSRFVNDMDLCLYPLQFGSANWGLFELLGRGRVVVASDRCYVPEVITHGENGFLCDYDDVASWVARTLEILDHPEQFRAIGETAREVSQRSSIDRVAEQFLELCERVIAMRTRD